VNTAERPLALPDLYVKNNLVNLLHFLAKIKSFQGEKAGSKAGYPK